MICLCNFQEALYPFSATHNTLFIEYKESALDVLVLLDIVPGVDDNRVLKRIIFGICGHTKVCQLGIPLKCVSLAGSRNNVEIFNCLRNRPIYDRIPATILL